MSQRFRKFVLRVAKDNEFQPIKNKYKNYPRLLELMKSYWPKYKDGSKISHLLRDHYEEIFNFYLNTIFPFRKGGLKFKNCEAPTPVDFKLEYYYRYNIKEIEIIEEVMQEQNIEGKVVGVLKRVLIFAVSSFSPMVEQIFGRPFAFQFSSIDATQYNNNEWEVKAVISAREQ